MEENSLQTVEMHLRHFSDTLGAAFDINQLKQENLQAHIDRRAKKKGFHKRKLSPVTLRKEMASFRAMWNWGVKAGQLTGPFPNQGLVFPKTEEKPPFQTWDEIQRQLGRGGLSAADEKALWDSLFLTVPQIQEILDHVRGQELQPFVYPMFCFAAHTGGSPKRDAPLPCDGRGLRGQADPHSREEAWPRPSHDATRSALAIPCGRAASMVRQPSRRHRDFLPTTFHLQEQGEASQSLGCHP